MTPYLIIGDGRLAKHFSHYFRLMNLPVLAWSRSQNNGEDLQDFLSRVERILLLISDNQIAEFIELTPGLKGKTLLHASGALTIKSAYTVHPLNTFGDNLYDLKAYEETPFIIEFDGPSFSELLPGLSNPHYAIAREKKSLYHALCVASGNFTTLLWQNVMASFEDEFRIPASALHPYLNRVAANLVESPAFALTGPMARGDSATIVRNLDALRGRPEQALYYAFLQYVLEKKKRLGDLEYERLNV